MSSNRSVMLGDRVGAAGSVRVEERRGEESKGEESRADASRGMDKHRQVVPPNDFTARKALASTLKYDSGPAIGCTAHVGGVVQLQQRSGA
ncbi:hypothetical protein PZA11_001316 [Diplocarpon coronariae]